MNLNLILLVSIGIVSYTCFNNRELYAKLLFSPYVIIRQKQWYRFITSAWVHSDFVHLFFNLFVLFFFGQVMESFFSIKFGSLGPLLYLILFVGSVVIGHIPTYLKEKDKLCLCIYWSLWRCFLGCYLHSYFYKPLEPLYLYAVIPIPGILFGVLYLLYTNYMSKRGGDNINHDAHMFGALGGMAILVILHPQVIPNFYSADSFSIWLVSLISKIFKRMYSINIQFNLSRV